MQEQMTVFGTWEITRPIGTGTYGKTYEILNFTQDKSVYKLMKIPVELKIDGEFPVKTYQDACKELRSDILGSVKYLQMHDNGKYFVKYEDCAITPSDDYKTLSVALRLEKLNSLASVIEVHKMSQTEVLRLAVNVCRSLERCREMDYIYTNLKPSNIFITETGCKLGDFGTFGLYEPKKINVAMRKSQDYMAPEMIRSGEINRTSDTYSLGLIMYALLNNNKLPFIPRYEENVGINDMQTAIEKRCSNYIFTDPDDASAAVKKIIFKACDPAVNNRYQTPTQMKNDLLVALGEEKEDDPFAQEIMEFTAAKEERQKETQTEKQGVHKVGNIAMYEYETNKKRNIVIDKKKKILLIAIAVVLVLLIAVIAVIVLQDNGASSSTVAACIEQMKAFVFNEAFYGR